MRLSFEREKILNAISIVSKAIPSKTTNSILQCILFDASKDEIMLTANDNEIGIKTKVEGSIQEKGMIALDARLIYDIIRKLDDTGDNIHIFADENHAAIISSGKSVFNIPGRDGEEFNYLPQIEKENYICLSQFSLKEVLRQTLFSALPNDPNKIMGGELLEVVRDKARFITLDGHRISIRNISLRDDYTDHKVIIPVKNLSEIGKIISDDNEKDVYIYFSYHYILFEFDDTIVVSRIIEGEYFNIEHMLLSDYELKIRINRLKLINAIDRSIILIRENDHRPLIFDIGEDLLKLRLESDYGTMRSEIECEKTGKDLMIAFNPKFLMDALRVIDDEFVEIYFTNAKSPCFIRDNDRNYIYVILPVNFIA